MCRENKLLVKKRLQKHAIKRKREEHIQEKAVCVHAKWENLKNKETLKIYLFFSLQQIIISDKFKMQVL